MVNEVCSLYSFGGDIVQVSTGVSSGFWVMVDMLSGRYLYQNLKGQATGEAVADD